MAVASTCAPTAMCTTASGCTTSGTGGGSCAAGAASVTRGSGRTTRRTGEAMDERVGCMHLGCVSCVLYFGAWVAAGEQGVLCCPWTLHEASTSNSLAIHAVFFPLQRAPAARAPAGTRAVTATGASSPRAAAATAGGCCALQAATRTRASSVTTRSTVRTSGWAALLWGLLWGGCNGVQSGQARSPRLLANAFNNSHSKYTRSQCMPL